MMVTKVLAEGKGGTARLLHPIRRLPRLNKSKSRFNRAGADFRRLNTSLIDKWSPSEEVSYEGRQKIAGSHLANIPKRKYQSTEIVDG